MKQREYKETSNTRYITKTTTYKDETGEHQIQEAEVFKKVYGSKHFYRVWLTDLLAQLNLISNSKQLDVFWYVLDNINTDNLFIDTYRKISEKTGISYKTVARIMRKLQDVDILVCVQRGVYRVNPKFLIKGDDIKKAKLTVIYEQEKAEEDSDERSTVNTAEEKAAS